MVRFMVVAVGVVALSCGQFDTPTATPTAEPLSQPTTIEYPEVVVSAGQFRMSYPCSFMLHTFYQAQVSNKEDALQTLKDELDSYIPEQALESNGKQVHGPSPLEFMHAKDFLVDQLLECHWQDERRDEIAAETTERQRKHEEELEAIKQQLRDYKSP